MSRRARVTDRSRAVRRRPGRIRAVDESHDGADREAVVARCADPRSGRARPRAPGLFELVVAELVEALDDARGREVVLDDDARALSVRRQARGRCRRRAPSSSSRRSGSCRRTGRRGSSRKRCVGTASTMMSAWPTTSSVVSGAGAGGEHVDGQRDVVGRRRSRRSRRRSRPRSRRARASCRTCPRRRSRGADRRLGAVPVRPASSLRRDGHRQLLSSPTATRRLAGVAASSSRTRGMTSRPKSSIMAIRCSCGTRPIA